MASSSEVTSQELLTRFGAADRESFFVEALRRSLYRACNNDEAWDVDDEEETVAAQSQNTFRSSKTKKTSTSTAATPFLQSGGEDLAADGGVQPDDSVSNFDNSKFRDIMSERSKKKEVSEEVGSRALSKVGTTAHSKSPSKPASKSDPSIALFGADPSIVGSRAQSKAQSKAPSRAPSRAPSVREVVYESKVGGKTKPSDTGSRASKASSKFKRSPKSAEDDARSLCFFDTNGEPDGVSQVTSIRAGR